ncbi:MAG TPA: DNA starvation/stationary phase protection protein [Candidatus Didemnitutus sp.]|nr:DNA starvation/stationary phase protection protein [Candidatus Didemnitutus sp.]
MKRSVKIGLSDKARQKVGEMLNAGLADVFALYAATRDYHWNVTGPHFHSLHKLFEEQYGELATAIDEIAERARALGEPAYGGLAALAKRSRLSAKPGAGLEADEMIAELLRMHEAVIVQLRKDIERCTDDLDDAGTADFLTGLMEDHEKIGWMLRALLVDNTDDEK